MTAAPRRAAGRVSLGVRLLGAGNDISDRLGWRKNTPDRDRLLSMLRQLESGLVDVEVGRGEPIVRSRSPLITHGASAYDEPVVAFDSGMI